MSGLTTLLREAHRSSMHTERSLTRNCADACLSLAALACTPQCKTRCMHHRHHLQPGHLLMLKHFGPVSAGVCWENDLGHQRQPGLQD